MLILVQLILYCLLFFLMVKAAVKDNGMNCLYFYPLAFIDEAAKRGLADKDETMKRGKRFMVPFCIIMLVVLFLVVMNWFDGICMDLVWVAHGKEWAIPGMEGIPYIKPLKSVLIKRTAGTVLYFIIALPVAGAAVLMGGVL